MDSEQEYEVDESTEANEVAAPPSAGARLRAAREAKRLELEHIASDTRIPIRHLASIETGQFEDLPSRAYAIGFAKTYAKAVDLDPVEITEAVREELAEGRERATAMAGGMEPGDPAKLPSAGLAWAGAIAALILAIGIIFFYSTYFGAGTGPASLIVENDEATDVAPVEAQQAAASEAPSGPSPDGQVVITATGEGAWVRFFADGGEVLFEGVMEAGDTYEVPRDATDPRLNTGRPNLLDITIDGQPVPRIADEMVPVGDARVSAEALLARANTPAARSAPRPGGAGASDGPANN